MLERLGKYFFSLKNIEVDMSSLMRRLQGLPFTEAYIPSEKITTAHIHWGYKGSSTCLIFKK